MTVSEMTAGVSPSFTSVRAKVASSAVSTMSDAATIPMPPARAAPATTVTTGLLSATMARCIATIARAPSSIGAVDASERSAPEQNTRPEDFSSTTRTSGSWSARANRSSSSVTSCRDSALRLCGESRVIVAIRSATS